MVTARRLLVPLALVALVGLAAAAAGQAQQVIASVDGEVAKTPDELPGTYEVSLTYTVQASGGNCLCKETRVQTLASAEAAEEISREPEAYLIDWVQHALGDAGSHAQPVNATVLVAEAPSQGPVEVTFDASMEHSPGQHIVSQSEPATVELPLPGGPDGDGAANERQALASNGADDEGTESQQRASAPLAAAGLAASVAAAVARRAHA